MAYVVEVFPKSEILGEVVLIFLAIGNWHKGFDRLVKAVDELRATGIITEDVIAQIGQGKYSPTNLEAIDYCSPDEFENLIYRAKLVISHAGIGTIAQAIKHCKPVVVVPRKASLGEHFDDHQFTTAKQLEVEGKILVAYEVSELPTKIEEAKTFVPLKEESSEKIIQVVKEFIDNLAAEKRSRSNKRRTRV